MAATSASNKSLTNSQTSLYLSYHIKTTFYSKNSTTWGFKNGDTKIYTQNSSTSNYASWYGTSTEYYTQSILMGPYYESKTARVGNYNITMKKYYSTISGSHYNYMTTLTNSSYNTKTGYCSNPNIPSELMFITNTKYLYHSAGTGSYFSNSLIHKSIVEVSISRSGNNLLMTAHTTNCYHDYNIINFSFKGVSYFTNLYTKINATISNGYAIFESKNAMNKIVTVSTIISCSTKIY